MRVRSEGVTDWNGDLPVFTAKMGFDALKMGSQWGNMCVGKWE